MRIGIFGGSFNPIHLGHLRAAEEDGEAMKLDLVYFVPAASPPHKPKGGLIPAEHRLAMVRLATKGNRRFMVSDVEVRRTGVSYTIDTVRHFLSTMRGQADLNLIMGADQFAELDSWKDCTELMRLSYTPACRRGSRGRRGFPLPRCNALATVNQTITTCIRAGIRCLLSQRRSSRFRRRQFAPRSKHTNRSAISFPTKSSITSSGTRSFSIDIHKHFSVDFFGQYS